MTPTLDSKNRPASDAHSRRRKLRHQRRQPSAPKIATLTTPTLRGRWLCFDADEPFVVLGDALVIGVGETTMPSDEELDEKLAQAHEVLVEESQNRLFRRYVEELKAAADIRVNAQLLEQLPPV